MGDKNATNGKRLPLKSKKICPVDGVELMALIVTGKQIGRAHV